MAAAAATAPITTTEPATVNAARLPGWAARGLNTPSGPRPTAGWTIATELLAVVPGSPARESTMPPLP